MQTVLYCSLTSKLFHSGLDAIALVDAEDILENTQNSLDELWRLDFPQARMSHLLEVIANQLARYVQVCIF